MAEEIHLRAGTLLHCTLAEPNFSSESAKIGEPLVCSARPLREFGRLAVPSGAYFVGQLESYREPGRFIGKGWIKLEFERLILPNRDIPLLSKVISVGDFTVDSDGKIHGSGHPTRDALGWAIPLFWPVKLITLPMRGPRPTLRGELPVTLRLLEDASIPRDAYFISQNPRPRAGDGSAQAQTKTVTWSESLREQTGARLDLNAPPISVRRRIQDRYGMPFRIEDRYRVPFRIEDRYRKQ
jgi:hypothetical protein